MAFKAIAVNNIPEVSEISGDDKFILVQGEQTKTTRYSTIDGLVSATLDGQVELANEAVTNAKTSEINAGLSETSALASKSASASSASNAANSANELSETSMLINLLSVDWFTNLDPNANISDNQDSIIKILISRSDINSYCSNIFHPYNALYT